MILQEKKYCFSNSLASEQSVYFLWDQLDAGLLIFFSGSLGLQRSGLQIWLRDLWSTQGVGDLPGKPRTLQNSPTSSAFFFVDGDGPLTLHSKFEVRENTGGQVLKSVRDLYKFVCAPLQIFALRCSSLSIPAEFYSSHKN